MFKSLLNSIAGTWGCGLGGGLGLLGYHYILKAPPPPQKKLRQEIFHLKSDLVLEEQCWDDPQGLLGEAPYPD